MCMEAKKIHYNQNLHPTIMFWRLKNAFPITQGSFSNAAQEVLQSCEWTLSRDNISGSFALSFYPECEMDGKKESVFDNIKILDIVEIYEPSENTVPVFIGVVKTKKITGSANAEGGFRRVSVQGYAITGLVSDYTINLDTTALALTKQLATNEDLQRALTIEFSNTFDTPLKKVIEKVWEYFQEAEKGKKGLVTSDVGLMIKTFLGDKTAFFDVDDSTIHYPLANMFYGQTTQSFFDIIDGLVPEPYYEKFAYTDENGTMKIKIRKVPFSPSDWVQLNVFNLDDDDDIANLVKSFTLEQSDREVYTVFAPYLSGYPVGEDKILKIAAMEENTSEVDGRIKLGEKFAIYGYRPLLVHFIGYTKPDGKDDESTKSAMQDVANNLKEMYEHLPDMVGGNITMSFYNRGKSAPIMCGDIVQFMGLQFYVDGVTHSWTYGQNGEINLSVSRGGVYNSGTFDAEKTAKAEIGSMAKLLK